MKSPNGHTWFGKCLREIGPSVLEKFGAWPSGNVWVEGRPGGRPVQMGLGPAQSGQGGGKMSRFFSSPKTFFLVQVPKVFRGIAVVFAFPSFEISSQQHPSSPPTMLCLLENVRRFSCLGRCQRSHEKAPVFFLRGAGERLTKVQATSRPENLWPEVWSVEKRSTKGETVLGH